MTEKRYEAIDREIEELKAEKASVKGTETEVYSRIVGYYRSVKNWNLGKKEEYKNRQVFTELDGKEAPVQLGRVPEAARPEAGMAGEISSYRYFYRTSCPNCPPMKKALDELAIEGESLNVDMERGMEEAARLMIFASPTVIFTNREGQEVFRTSKPSDVTSLFERNEVSA